MFRNRNLPLWAVILALSVTPAAPVLAQTATTAAASAEQVSAYRNLMEANGTSENVRLILNNSRAAVRLVVLERAGKTSLTPDEELRFNKIADNVLGDTENTVITNIARAQSVGFTVTEINHLTRINQTAAARKYNKLKFANPEANAATIQTYMVDTVVWIIKTYREDSDGQLADGLPVAEAPTDPALKSRFILAQTLLTVDGTEAIVRHFVGQVHMKLIVTEVGKYIELDSLSENERYRLATIVATATTNLGDRIVALTAQGHANVLSEAELRQLIVDFSHPAQGKLTQLRIDDTGELDKDAELLIQAAALQVVQQFEAK